MKLICRQCGIHYEKGKFCLECGSPLEEVQVQKVLYCANCQMVVESGKFCPECGTKLEEREVEVSTSTNSKSHTVSATDIETVSTNISSGDEEIEAILSKYRDEYGDMRTLNTEEYAVAAEELQKCVDKGNVEAMCFLAILYMDGHGVPKDETVAYNLMRTAEDLGSEYAKAIMAIFYLNGMIVQQDVDEALNRLTTGYKELQHPQIAGILALIYYNMADYKTALKYATEAAEKNDKTGLTVLGSCYLNGNEVNKNDEKAFEYYIQAAAMGEEMALNQIGWMYMNGCGVEEDPSQAFFWYNESANKQSDVGMYNLACCYRDGYGVEQDSEKAAEWYKKAAEAEYIDAMLALGQYYQEHMIDFDKAEKWLIKAAEAGSTEAMNMLGVFYSDTMCDDTSAVKWYKKAVELDQPNAFRNLALCYRDGRGVKKNEKKAEELLKKANEFGIEDAKEILKEMTTPTAKISNIKYIPNVTQDNTLGVEFSLDLNVDGMLGKKLNISVVDTDNYTSKSVFNKPCKHIQDPIECVYCKVLKPTSTPAVWKSYKFFVPYYMLSELKSFNNTLVISIWNQSEKQPVKLANTELPYELAHTKHLFKADEWHFALLNKS